MNEDAVTWTQVSVIGAMLFFFWALGRLSKKIERLESQAGEKVGATDGSA